ncbi:hypothetical protein P154DRAFT_69277 [Amniculicola lignicola CBS 123094]|uniref:Uncharacterized protein n=1 Tax=Amniculicola lignicola CBS 123094 TaxID=1392246 RepID=A0A6A5W392_9PLEO|nr:hypothetical protein P154DRAFT_69277 [Amniculicola lignicola CBS 123094]
MLLNKQYYWAAVSSTLRYRYSRSGVSWAKLLSPARCLSASFHHLRRRRAAPITNFRRPAAISIPQGCGAWWCSAASDQAMERG